MADGSTYPCTSCTKEFHPHQVAKRSCSKCGEVIALCWMCGNGGAAWTLTAEMMASHEAQCRKVEVAHLRLVEAEEIPSPSGIKAPE